MELNGYSYKRFPDACGRQVHVVETRHGRFEADSKEAADRLAWMAECAYQHKAEREDERRQMMLDEQLQELEDNWRA